MPSHHAHYAPSPAIEPTTSRSTGNLHRVFGAWTAVCRLVSDAISLAHAEEHGQPLPPGPLNRIRGRRLED